MGAIGKAIGGVFGGGNKLPSAPDPASTIAAQERANQLFQITPQGTLEYGTGGIDGFTPDPTARGVRVTESPFQKSLRTGVEELVSALIPQLTPTLGGVRTASDIEGGIGSLPDVETRIFEQGIRRLEPRFAQERNRLEQQLANQGIPRGSEAFNESLRQLQESQSDATQDLLFRSQETARGARTQSLNEQLGLANLENIARARAFGEVGTLGGFATPFQQVQTPGIDAAGIINQGFANQFNKSQAQNTRNRQVLSDTINLASGAAMAFSDKRLKENIKKIGSSKSGLNKYEFSYVWDKTIKYVGVVAQELLEKVPHAVIKDAAGYYKVDYSKIDVDFIEV